MRIQTERRILAYLTLLMAASGCWATATYGDETVEGKLLRQYCADCHGADTQEAGVRLDNADRVKQLSVDAGTLNRLLTAVGEHKMPPQDAEQPTARQRASLVTWLEERLMQLAQSARRTGRWTRNRRLTTKEYHYTMQDLFGVDAQFDDLLPADPISNSGYRNDSQRLGLSSLQIEAYLDSARRAVNRYVVFEKKQPPPLRYHVEFEELFYSTAVRYETRKKAPEAVDFSTFVARRAANLASAPKYVDPLGPSFPGAYSDDEKLRDAIPKLHQQFVAIPRRLAVGEMILRVRAAATAGRDGRFPRVRVAAGVTLGDGCSIDKRVLGEIDVTAPISRPGRTNSEFGWRMCRPRVHCVTKTHLIASVCSTWTKYLFPT